MSRLLQPVDLNDAHELIDIITEVMDEIQNGASVVDREIGHDEYGYIDLLAVNEAKRGMLFFLNCSDQEADYLRAFKSLQWYHENQNILQRLYAGKIDFTYPPYIIFLSPHFSPIIQKVLLALDHGRIILMKYLCFRIGQETKIFLEKISDSIDYKNSIDYKENRQKAHIEGSLLLSAEAAKSKLSAEAAESNSTADSPTNSPPAEKPLLNLKKFRQEMEIDISHISDEELLELLG